MRFLIASDKFKGSLTSQQANSAIASAIQQSHPHAMLTSIEVSDGGEGFLDAVAASNDRCQRRPVATVDALRRAIISEILIDPVDHAAYVESAKAAGLDRLANSECCPASTSTFGVGLLIKHALQAGATTVYLGLGGSSTNDGGTGIAAALGYRFFDHDGNEFVPTGGSLASIERILPPQGPDAELLEGNQLIAINDVRNPLTGDQGAAVVYGPQNGADEATVKLLDDGLVHLAKVVHQTTGQANELADVPGAGAAGGMGFGMMAFFGATFMSAAELLLTTTRWDSRPSPPEFDWVVTGEGKLDRQTEFGKWVGQFGKFCKNQFVGVRTVVFCGQNELDADALATLGIDECRALWNPGDRSMDEALLNAEALLGKVVRQWSGSLQGQLRNIDRIPGRED